MLAIRPCVYESDRAFIREGIGRYSNSKPIASALILAEQILNYVPDYSRTWKLELQKRMGILRDAGKTPLDLIQRVAEHYSVVEKHPHLFKSQRAEHNALARHVLHLTKWHRWRPNSRLLLQLGQMLSEDLGAFSIQLLRRLHEDLAARQSLRRQAADFDGVNQ